MYIVDMSPDGKNISRTDRSYFTEASKQIAYFSESMKDDMGLELSVGKLEQMFVSLSFFDIGEFWDRPRNDIQRLILSSPELAAMLSLVYVFQAIYYMLSNFCLSTEEEVSEVRQIVNTCMTKFASDSGEIKTLNSIVLLAIANAGDRNDPIDVLNHFSKHFCFIERVILVVSEIIGSTVFVDMEYARHFYKYFYDTLFAICPQAAPGRFDYKLYKFLSEDEDQDDKDDWGRHRGMIS